MNELMIDDRLDGWMNTETRSELTCSTKGDFFFNF